MLVFFNPDCVKTYGKKDKNTRKVLYIYHCILNSSEGGCLAIPRCEGVEYKGFTLGILTRLEFKDETHEEAVIENKSCPASIPQINSFRFTFCYSKR